MKRISVALVFLISIALLPAAAAPPAGGGGTGAGELALDRGAVTSVIAAVTPGPRGMMVPGLGQITVALRPPQTVFFRDGGVEARLGLAVKELALEGDVDVRMEPQIRESDGVVLLRTVRIVGRGPLEMLPDLSGLMPPVELPRRQDLIVQPKGGRRTRVILHPQNVRIDDERMVLEFGVVTREEPNAP
jgi:hypothetical protein